MSEPSVAAVTVISADEEVLDQVLSLTATVGLDPTVVGDPLSVRPHWAEAPMIIVGVDLAARLLPLGLPRRPEVYVVGPAERQPELAAWSGPLGATVVALPDSAGWLGGPLAEVAGVARCSRVVAVVGGCGGAGASTLAAALAGAAVRRRQATFLVDADPTGGGLDLLLGAERLPGWRWPRLARARGLVGDLRGHVVTVDGLDLLSHDRDIVRPTAEAMTTVLGSAARSHQLVVIDVGRGAIGAAALERVDHVLLVLPARVRAVAAAEHTLADLTALADSAPSPELVVRVGRDAGPDPETVAAGLGCRLLAEVPEDPGVMRAAERGEPPGRLPRSRLGRAAERILDGWSARDRSAEPPSGPVPSAAVAPPSLGRPPARRVSV